MRVSRARQKAYSQVRGDREVYTPQVVVNGSVHVVGSDRAGIENAIDDHQEVRRRHVGAGRDDADWQADQCFGRGIRQAGRRDPWRSLDLFGHRRRCRFRSAAARMAAAKSPTTMSCATCSRSATGTAASVELDGAAGKYFPRGRRRRGGLRPGRQSRQARADAGRGVHVASLIVFRMLLSFALRSTPAASPTRGSRCSKKKKDQLSLVPDVVYAANRPDPDGPGGLGAEESGTERTGPTQDSFSQSSTAVAWRKLGGIMIELTIP